MTELSLNGLEVCCIIGDLPEERARAQRLVVDATMEVDAAAADTDELAGTVDYAALAGAIRRALVDATMEVDAAAAETDELAGTVDYAALAGAIRRALVDAKCRMIERAARIAAEECMRDGRVASATVTVTKSGAVEGLRSASARVALRRKGA